MGFGLCILDWGGQVTISLIALVLLSAVIASSQVVGGGGSAGVVRLVAPVPGVPVSVEQVEEYVRTHPGQSATTQSFRTHVYRDSAGRMRIESGGSGPSDQVRPMVTIIDPVGGSTFMLMVAEKVAARMVFPRSGSGIGLPGPPSTGTPERGLVTRTEKLGKRIIEGLEFEGMRIVRTSQGESQVVSTEENWTSADLGLTGLSEAKGPDGRYTARLEHIVRGEPNSSLFSIPPGYAIRDLGFSDAR
ncbi:MAG TPA: hypothetical protein VKV29_03695 [Chthonomonas sp.]|uniref:hypothetical protein n=1 Tax=Chthonomonas sp. TaxID=2282153 RepID=UPI002B4AE59D|nr:hypothetical protein [Chthonomonas sp.]HLH79367.1 hypothetical protein [Chthonomonas sp.]